MCYLSHVVLLSSLRPGQLQIIQKLGRRRNARHKQMIPCAGARNVQQVAFRIVNLFEISIVGDGRRPQVSSMRAPVGVGRSLTDRDAHL
jgi:hypothetical protein